MMRRLLTLAAMHLAVTPLLMQLLAPPHPVVVWNGSPSAPVGLYAVEHRDTFARGDLVVVRPPVPLADFLAERGYLPLGVPLVKHIAAAAGQRVCRRGRQVAIDGQQRADALDRDHLGRRLPTWSDCYQLGAGEIFALNEAPDSLDSRYFGPLPTSSIIGVARPLWLPASSPGHRL